MSVDKMDFNNFNNFNSFGTSNGFTGFPPAAMGGINQPVFNMPAMPNSLLGNNNLFPSMNSGIGGFGGGDIFNQNYGAIFEQNIQQTSWSSILGFLANYKMPQIDFSKFIIPAEEANTDNTEPFSYDAKELKEKWQSKKPDLSDEFYSKTVEIAKKLNCSPDELMGVMNAESGINSSIKNAAGGSATGLIQFIDSTAKSLGTTTEKLAKMSPEKQLDYVEKYLVSAKASAGIGENEKISGGTLYALIFLPARANKNILASQGEGNNYYEHNKGLDKNKDGNISRKELDQRVRDFSA